MHVIQFYISEQYITASGYDFLHFVMTQHPLDENDVGNGNIVASIDKF
jgi:hypothetical protein